MNELDLTLQELIGYFRMGVETSSAEDAVDFDTVNRKAVRLGYVVHPDCCNRHVLGWLDSLTPNYNATFYKEWNDVISKDRFSLFVDQLLHYATTYGTDFQLGNGYVPNEGAEAPPFKELKVLMSMSENVMFHKCLGLVRAGSPLDAKTVATVCSFIEYYVQEWGDDSVVELLESVKNREAQAVLASKLKLMPKDEFGILRCLVYRYTHAATLVKDPETIANIKAAAAAMRDESPLNSLSETQFTKLSRIFLRYKTLFLAMKTADTAAAVNKLRRLAKKNHRPLERGFWETIATTRHSVSTVATSLADLDNFRKVRILSMLSERIALGTSSGVFHVRSGKTFVRDDYAPKYDMDWLKLLFDMTRASLVNSLAKKACRVRLPEHFELALPSTEKSFVGNVPLGTRFAMTENNIIGVYWRNEWGTRDFDLSLTDVRGNRIAWNSDYSTGGRKNAVVYSGDMTNANPEAVELLYAAGEVPDGMVMLNKFAGGDRSKFRLFYANECLDPKDMLNHMVNPNCVKFDEIVEFNGQGQKTIGFVLDGKFYVCDFKTGKGRVSSKGEFVRKVVEAEKAKLQSAVMLKDVLTDAGYTFVGKGDEADIDLSVPKKNDILGILAD